MKRIRHPMALLAGALNLVVPGLGLFYLGCRKRAIINFVTVTATLVLITFVFPNPKLVEHIHYFILGLAIMSGGYAHGVAISKEKGHDVAVVTPQDVYS